MKKLYMKPKEKMNIFVTCCIEFTSFLDMKYMFVNELSRMWNSNSLFAKEWQWRMWIREVLRPDLEAEIGIIPNCFWSAYFKK